MKNILIISSIILSLNVLGGNPSSSPRPRQEQKRSSCSGPRCRPQQIIIVKPAPRRVDHQKKTAKKFFLPEN